MNVQAAPEGQHPVPSAQAVHMGSHWPACLTARLAVMSGAAGRRNSRALARWEPRRMVVAQRVYIVYVMQIVLRIVDALQKL